MLNQSYLPGKSQYEQENASMVELLAYNIQLHKRSNHQVEAIQMWVSKYKYRTDSSGLESLAKIRNLL